MADRDYRDYETDDLRYRRGEERDYGRREGRGGQQQGERFSGDWQGGQQGGFGERQQSGYGQSPAQQGGYAGRDYDTDQSGYHEGSYGQSGMSRGGYDDWDDRGTRAFPRGRGREFARGYGGYEDERGIHRGGRTAHAGYGADPGFRPGMYGYSGGYGGQAGPSRWSSGRPYRGGERGYGEGGRDFWDRASDEVSSWFGDEQAERRREMDRHRGRGPKNYTRSDERIKEDVSDRLTDDGALDASDIEVAISGGEVTLNGHISNRWDKRRAEDIAEEVSGVRHVQNNLRVRQEIESSSGAYGASGSSTGSRYGSSSSASSGSTGSSGLSGSSRAET